MRPQKNRATIGVPMKRNRSMTLERIAATLLYLMPGGAVEHASFTRQMDCVWDSRVSIYEPMVV